MQLPTLTELSTSRSVVDAFGGYNHNLRIGDGEFYDMKNLTSTYYPILSPRGQRGTYATPSNPQGLIAKDSLCYVDGQYFVMNNDRVDMGLSVEASDCPKTLVSMGAYVIILPDKKYINTANLTEYGSIEASVTSTGSVSFSLCKLDSKDYTITYYDKPSEPKDGEYWMDTTSVPHSLKQYSETNAMWVTVPTTYIKITSTGIGLAFSQYDGVKISGLKDVTLTDYDSGDTFTDSDISAIDGTFTIMGKGDDYIIVTGIISQARNISNAVTVKREMPLMDFVVESENRLWGCRYGTSIDGKVVNEIYASKLGDFKNWNCFMGLSTDSYAASCGTDGQFTGAITYLGHPLFFKESCVHKVFGNYPSNFQIQTTACRGVQKGSHKSLAMVNEVLYYKSRTGICAYDGSLPTEISSAFGELSYSDAIGCSHGNKYYISMKDESGEYNLFVFDVSKGMWHKEDDVQIDAFCSCRNELYYIDHSSKKIKTILGIGTKDTDTVQWMAESGVIGVDYPDKKYISKMTFRLALDIGTIVHVYIQYDSMGQWEHVCTMTGSSLRSFSYPIRPKRCDHMRIRIVGYGDAKIYSITKTIEQGSDT